MVGSVVGMGKAAKDGKKVLELLANYTEGGVLGKRLEMDAQGWF